MVEAEPSLPPELTSVDVTAGVARVEIDETRCPLDALYGAAYILIDRCWVLLDRPRPERLRVTLAPRNGDAAQLPPLIGELAEEVQSCVWRHQVTHENRDLIEAVAARAIVASLAPPSLDDLEGFDFSAGQLDDPLGLSVSWEDKYQKKKETR